MSRGRIILGSLTVFVCHLVLAGAARADDQNWVDKLIIVKRNDVKVSYTEPNGVQRQVPSKNIVQRVRSTQNGWLEVGNDGEPGWFNKNDVVLLDEAPAYFTTQIQAHPGDSQAYAYRGVVWRYKGEMDKAIQDLTMAIQLSPATAAWYNDRGLTYNNMKNFDLAIADYTEAIRLNPRWALFYNNRGLAYANKLDYDRAIANYNEALGLDPRYALAYDNRGLAFYGKKEYGRAIADYTAALGLDPKNFVTYNDRGNAYRNQKDYERAINDYNEAILLEGKDAIAYANAAWLLGVCPKESVRDGKKAITYANVACKLTDWKNANYVATLAAACAEDGQFADAIQWQKKALVDTAYAKQNGEEANARLMLYEQNKPFRVKP